MAPTGRASWRRIAVVAAMAAQCGPSEPNVRFSEVKLEVRLGVREAAFIWSDGPASTWEATAARLSRAQEQYEQIPVRIVVVDAGVTMQVLGGVLDWLHFHGRGDRVSLAVDDGSSGAAVRLTNLFERRNPEVVCAQIELDDDGRRVRIDIYEHWRKQKSGLYDPRPTEQKMFVRRAATPAEDATLPFERSEDLFVAPGELGEAAESLGARVLARALTASHPCPRAVLQVARYLPWSRASVHFAVLHALGVDELSLAIR